MSFKFSYSQQAFYPDGLSYPELPDDVVPASSGDFEKHLNAPHNAIRRMTAKGLVIEKAVASIDDARKAKLASLWATYRAARAPVVAFTNAAGVKAEYPKTESAAADLQAVIDAGEKKWKLGIWIGLHGNVIEPFTYADIVALRKAVDAPSYPTFHDLLFKAAVVINAESIDDILTTDFDGK